MNWLFQPAVHGLDNLDIIVFLTSLWIIGAVYAIFTDTKLINTLAMLYSTSTKLGIFLVFLCIWLWPLRWVVMWRVLKLMNREVQQEPCADCQGRGCKTEPFARTGRVTFAEVVTCLTCGGKGHVRK